MLDSARPVLARMEALAAAPLEGVRTARIRRAALRREVACCFETKSSVGPGYDYGFACEGGGGGGEGDEELRIEEGREPSHFEVSYVQLIDSNDCRRLQQKLLVRTLDRRRREVHFGLLWINRIYMRVTHKVI